MSPPPQFWDGVLRRLRAKLPAVALEAWVEPLVAESRGAAQANGNGGADELLLLCPTAFHRDRVRERYLPEIAACLEAETGRPFEVALRLAPAAPVRRATAPPVADPRRRPPSAAPPPRGPGFQPTLPYTFANFVVGSCNALAREASYALACGRQQRLDPLYLTSALGLGKTHLARATVEETRGQGAARVIYTSAEAFTGEFTGALRSKGMAGFKRRYRSRCDLMVLEDVQFLASKHATQLELFHSLEFLLGSGARVILTGDRLPRDIEKMDPRLRSLMSAGLVAELEPPGTNVRREILCSKAAAGGVRLPDDCVELLVESPCRSVRDLEGVLIQLVACASLLKRRIDLELTRSAMRKIAPEPPPRCLLEPREVIHVVAGFFRTRPEILASRTRRRDVLTPRQLAMYLCRRYTDASLAEIGQILGRDHPAVSNAVKVVERRILEHAPLRYQLESLCERLDDLVSRQRRSRDGAFR